MKSLIGLLLVVAACGGTARNATKYSADTQQLLATHNDQLTNCYNDALKGDPKLAGSVTIHFVVEKKSGTIAHPSIDAAKTTAPDAVSQCVLKGIDGLQLQPGDKHEGIATFVYDFSPSGASASMPAAEPTS